MLGLLFCILSVVYKLQYINKKLSKKIS